MLRRNDCIKEFKNGNINIKYDPDTIKEAEKDELLTLSSVLDNIDCYFIGETYCIYFMSSQIENLPRSSTLLDVKFSNKSLTHCKS